MSGSAPELLCIDASTALAFVLSDDPLHSQALVLFRSLSALGTQLCAPALFAYECDSVIRLRVWKGRLSDAQAVDARAAIAALPLVIEYDSAVSDRAFEIATQYHQSRAYDTAYAAHAEARGVELVTGDRPFFEAVAGSKKPPSAPPLSWVKLLV